MDEVGRRSEVLSVLINSHVKADQIRSWSEGKGGREGEEREVSQ